VQDGATEVERWRDPSRWYIGRVPVARERGVGVDKRLVGRRRAKRRKAGRRRAGFRGLGVRGLSMGVEWVSSR
jgi:hypothetical protein